MKKTLIFLTILLFTASVFAVDNNNVASFTEWIQINGYTPGFTDDPGDIIEQWAAPNGSPMGIEWDADNDFIWHVSENAPNDCMYQIEVATPHAVLNSYPCPNPYGIPDGGSMNGACIGNGYFAFISVQIISCIPQSNLNRGIIVITNRSPFNRMGLVSFPLLSAIRRGYGDGRWLFLLYLAHIHSIVLSVLRSYIFGAIQSVCAISVGVAVALACVAFAT